MGFLGSLFGTNSNYQTAPGTSATTGDLSGANSGFASTQQQQQGLNQTQQQQQQALLSALGAQGGLQNQSNVFNQQQQTANQLQNIANGTGPNPAAAMLAQQTGANVANQAALMAGQRGAGSNAGLIARQAAQQGAATQQQAVGQGATMQAQQSLGALGQLQGQQQNMAALAGQQAGQQIQGTQFAGQLAQSGQAQANTLSGQNLQTQAGLASSANQLSAQQAMANAQNNQKTVGGVLGGVGAALGMASGGQVPEYMGGAQAARYAGGTISAGSDLMSDLGSSNGNMSPGNFSSSPNSFGVSSGADLNNGVARAMNGPKSTFAQSLGKGVSGFASAMSADDPKAPQVQVQPLQKFFAKGGKVPAMVSPGEKRIPKSEVPKIAAGEKSAIEAGKTIPGKAKVKGAKDSLKNDTVPMDLDAGDIILPRSVTQAKNPHWAAHKFVSAIMKEKGLRK